MKAVKFLPVVIILGLVTYLVMTSFSSALTYYVTASEFYGNPSKHEGKNLKIAGWVLKGSIQKDAMNPLKIKFTVREGEVHIPVTYTGLVPDAFKDDSEVVVTGKWNGTEIVSTEILAKCASKYTEMETK